MECEAARTAYSTRWPVGNERPGPVLKAYVFMYYMGHMVYNERNSEIKHPGEILMKYKIFVEIILDWVRK